jgi:hypothetical protein
MDEKRRRLSMELLARQLEPLRVLRALPEERAEPLRVPVARGERVERAARAVRRLVPAAQEERQPA